MQKEEMTIDEILLRIRDKEGLIRITLEEIDSLAVTLRNELVNKNAKITAIEKEKEALTELSKNLTKELEALREVELITTE